jgi:ADP-heptose:LPS heptosyltransferase
MLITTPVFRAFKISYPDTKVIVIASVLNKDILRNNPYVDQVIINHKNNLLRDIFSLIKLRMLNIDTCIEFDHSVVPHAILRLKIIKPKAVISVRKDGRYGISGDELKIYDYYTDKKKNIHSSRVWLDTLEPFGIRGSSNKYDLFINDLHEELAINFLKQFSSKCKIGINLEGAVRGKKILYTELMEISKGIKKINKNIQIIILTSPEKNKKIVKMINQMNLNYICPSYKTNNIQDVAAIIKNLDLIISPDTSIVHIASAFNKPIVSIHENNTDSYQLFSPISTVNKTVFSPSSKGLNGFDVTKVIDFSNELIKEIS